MAKFFQFRSPNSIIPDSRGFWETSAESRSARLIAEPFQASGTVERESENDDTVLAVEESGEATMPRSARTGFGERDSPEGRGKGFRTQNRPVTLLTPWGLCRDSHSEEARERHKGKGRRR